MATWVGSISQTNGQLLHDIHISDPQGSLSLTKDATLTFLSLVDTGRIPLRLRCSPILEVHTSDSETASWLDVLLCPDGDQPDGQAWWQTSSYESPVGILASISQAHTPAGTALHPTDILFFAVRSSSFSPSTPPRSSSNIDLDDTIHVHAILLSDDLHPPISTTELTPPPSPSGAAKALLLPSFVPAATPHQPPERPHRDPSTTTATASPPRPTTSDALPLPLDSTNKSLLVRTILFSLRMHGLSASRVPLPARTPADHAAEAEFKATYHAVLRAAQFALRTHLPATTDLRLHAERVRELVDAWVQGFVVDPLEPREGDRATPFATPRTEQKDGAGGSAPFATPRGERMQQPGEAATGGSPFPRTGQAEARVRPEGKKAAATRRKREAGF